jgi:hypothetical protein
MKKLMLRSLGLAVIVLLSQLSTAKAAVGDCHISCCDGTCWNGPVASSFDCCQLFGTICGYKGNAYYETSFGPNYCPNFGSCGN